MSPVGIVGFGALSLLVLLWLLISFQPAGPRRAPLEWAAATALYLSLCMLFLHWALQAESRLATIALGFLVALFSCGGLVALINALRALRGPPAKPPQSATN